MSEPILLVAKISDLQATKFIQDGVDVDIQTDANGFKIIAVSQATYLLAETEYEIIDFAPSFLGAPAPRPRKKH